MNSTTPKNILEICDICDTLTTPISIEEQLKVYESLDKVILNVLEAITSITIFNGVNFGKAFYCAIKDEIYSYNLYSKYKGY